MSKPLITINNWAAGISSDDRKWFADMKWIDIFTKDWVAQINLAMEAQTVNAWVTWDITSFTETNFSWTTAHWLVTDSGQISKSTDSWVNWATPAHTMSSPWSWVKDIIYFNWVMYFARDTSLWRTTDGSSFVDSFTAGVTTNFANWVEPHFFIVFQNTLYISDWHNLASLDSTWGDFNSAAFTIPSNETIWSMEILWNELSIGTDKWTFYLWDWSSANASQIITTNIWGLTAIVEIENTLFIFGSTYWVIYIYNGSDLIPYITIPDWNQISWATLESWSSVKHTSVTKYQNWMAFGVNNNWIFVLSRNNKQQPFALTRYWDTSTTPSSTIMYALYAVNPLSTNDRLMAWFDNKVDQADTVGNDYYTLGNNYIDTAVFDTTDDNWFKSLTQWVQLLFDNQSSLSAWRVSYKIDRENSWNLMATTFSESDDDKIVREIMSRWREIQFRIEIWDNSDSNAILLQLKVY